jgi:hypothetical protein
MSKRKAQVDDFELDELRLDPASVAPAPAKSAAPAPRLKKNRGFVMVPTSWVRGLAQAQACTYRLALHVLYLDWKHDGHQFRLTNEGLGAANVSRWGKYAALRELEGLGLVTVDRRFKKSPLIKVRRD